MDLENQTFPNGRHRNKTYLWVFENDKELCQMVINGERSRFIPKDFSYFLSTKMKPVSVQHSIAERNARHFVKQFDKEMRHQFRAVVGELDIKTEQMHSPSTLEYSNSFLGVFYHFFVHKHVANITETNGFYKFLDICSSIFPFPVLEELKQRDIDILNVIDDELLDEMQTFLNEHFDGVEIRSFCRKFFGNITNCKQKNVAEMAIVEAVKDLNLKGLPANDEVDSFNDNEKCEYLETYPRLNDAGVLRYRSIYNMLLQVTELYGKPCNVQAFKYEKDYLLKLPEINFYELYSLLNVDFLHSDRPEYVYRFKKYLFFFINALNNPSKPVFFIDDGLFECLQHYNTFKKSRDDVETLKFELSMLTLVFRRKHGISENREIFHLDDDDLRDVKKYFERFAGISNALLKDEIRTEVLESEVFMSTERVALNICFRNTNVEQIEDFFELIIHGALSENNFERLVIYNAFTGKETSISMPSNKEAIIEFIRKYNKYDFSRTTSPEKVLTWGLEKYYRGDVANWNSELKFKY